MQDSWHYWAIIGRSLLHLQGKPLSLYKHIAAESLHLYGQDPVLKTGLFHAPLLQTLINKVWFKNKENEGIIHPEFSENDTLSMATMAFVLTVVSPVLQNHIQVVYKTLNGANKPFRLKKTWTNGSPVIMSMSLSPLQPTRQNIMPTSNLSWILRRKHMRQTSSLVCSGICWRLLGGFILNWHYLCTHSSM